MHIKQNITCICIVDWFTRIWERWHLRSVMIISANYFSNTGKINIYRTFCGLYICMYSGKSHVWNLSFLQDHDLNNQWLGWWWIEIMFYPFLFYERNTLIYGHYYIEIPPFIILHVCLEFSISLFCFVKMEFTIPFLIIKAHIFTDISLP